jgi:hypothetical protein
MIGGVHLSAGREERAKVARLEASSCGGGGNPAGCHRRAGRLGQLRGRNPVGRGGAAGWKEKREWTAAGPKGRMGQNLSRIISEYNLDF